MSPFMLAVRVNVVSGLDMEMAYLDGAGQTEKAAE